MEVFRNGKFSHVITAKQLSRGVRKTKRAARNSNMLITCIGAVGRDDVLQVLEKLERIDTSVVTDSFPFPQLFVFTRMVIICSSTKIYELVDDVLVEKLSTIAGSTWSAVDFFDYIYLSNGKVSVERDPQKMTYSISDLPTAIGMCNYNGQIIIGAPNVEVTSG